jgi:hypothetical protein
MVAMVGMLKEFRVIQWIHSALKDGSRIVFHCEGFLKGLNKVQS